MKLDDPLDPSGDAYTWINEKPKYFFMYMIVCRHKVFYTNSKKRFKKHYKAAKKRNLPGTWLIWDEWYESYHWWRIILSDKAL